jgi:glutamate carboxypeptidase
MTHTGIIKPQTLMPDDLLAWCTAERAWVRETIEALVRLESPSTSKIATDRCGAELAARLSAIGGAVTRVAGHSRGDHVIAEFSGGPSRVMLLGHLDTVWPVGQIETMPLREESGRLYGPGIFDMKGGIGVMMLAMRALQQRQEGDRPRVTIVVTTDEEIGSGTSRTLIETTARQCDAVLVLEPSLPGGAAKTSRKGCGEFELTVHGVSAHAGVDPTRGASAIHELARQILAIEELQDLQRGITVNVGVVTGGSRTNVVADTAQASIDVRVQTMDDAAAVEASLRALRPHLRGTRLDVRGSVGRPPLERNAQVAALYELARAAARESGQDLAEGGTGGGSDGNFTAAIGVPTLDGLGPRGDGAHALHEHIEIDDLPWRAALVTSLLSRIGR